MSRKSKPKFKAVRVIWSDAHADTTGWVGRDEISKEPCLVQTVGWLIPDAKPDHLTVAQSMIYDGSTLDHVLHIPRAMVVSTSNID